jgi:hypothetical protein
MNEAYSSTVTSRWHLGIGLLITVVTVGVVLAIGAGALVAVVLAVVLIATSVFVSTVRLVVGNGRVVLGQGPLAWPSRTIPVADIISAAAEELTGAEALGVGVPWRWRTTRLTVRPGPTLALTLRSGEVLRVSTSRPDQAVQLISAPSGGASPTPRRSTMTENVQDHRPWFGPKRAGYGIRPQTWQGWLVVAGFVVVIVAVARVLAH